MVELTVELVDGLAHIRLRDGCGGEARVSLNHHKALEMANSILRGLQAFPPHEHHGKSDWTYVFPDRGRLALDERNEATVRKTDQ